MRSAVVLLVLGSLLRGAEPDIAPALQQLASGDDAARAEAALALRATLPGREDVVAGLTPLLEHENPTVRFAAVETLESLLLGYGGGLGGRADRRAKVRVVVTPESEAAVEKALDWLARYQDRVRAENSTPGRWDSDEFMKHAPYLSHLDGAGRPLLDEGVTALALLAYLGAGYTDLGEHRFTTNVAMGLDYLMDHQDIPFAAIGLEPVPNSEGHIGIGTNYYPRALTSHAAATLALVEAWILTGNGRYRSAAQRALARLERAKTGKAWGYPPPNAPDAHTTGWALFTLAMGRLGGLDVAPGVLADAREWMDGVTDPEDGTVGYETRGPYSAVYGWTGTSGDLSPGQGWRARFYLDREKYDGGLYTTCTALSVWSESLLAAPSTRASMPRKRHLNLAQALPEWDREGKKVDCCTWAYTALALMNHEGMRVPSKETRAWFTSFHEVVLRRQRTDGVFEGSWDPVGPWGQEAGRIYSTAMIARALEAPYLFPADLNRRTRLPGAHKAAYAALRKHTGSKEPDARVRERASAAVERIRAVWVG